MKRAFGPVVLLVALLAASCASIGPKTIPRDQFDYGAAISDSSRQQILANIVGLRYVEAPLFVNVVSVINQYALEGDVAAGLGTNASVTGKDTVSLGAGARWADRPTITYTPVAGRDFAASLLTPLPPESLFALVQAGWPPELILRMTVSSINGVENERGGPSGRSQADPRLVELLQVWGRLRNARVLGLRRDEGEGSSRIVVYVNERLRDPGVVRDLAFFRETLGLDPDLGEARLTYGLIPDESNEIAVLTMSILELMNEFAWRIDAPPIHVEEGRTVSTFVTEATGVEPLIRIHHAEERPEYAFVAVENRDHWFYIDDRDTVSKRTFALIQILLSLTDTGETARGPVVSLSN